jgi:hypothetical protein
LFCVDHHVRRVFAYLPAGREQTSQVRRAVRRERQRPLPERVATFAPHRQPHPLALPAGGPADHGTARGVPDPQGTAPRSPEFSSRHEGHRENVAQPFASDSRRFDPLERHLHLATAPLPGHSQPLREHQRHRPHQLDVGHPRVRPVDNTLREDRQEAQTGQRLHRVVEQDIHDQERTDCRLLPEDPAAGQVLLAVGVDEQQERVARGPRSHQQHQRQVLREGLDRRDLRSQGLDLPPEQ